MKLNENSIRWAFTHILHEKDTDLFPRLIEYDLFESNIDTIVNELKDIDIGSYNWQPHRKFLIPKGEFSYRVATQLDPIDSILFAAIIYEYGNLIEKLRVPIEQNKVFNYRFQPTSEGSLYNKKNAWNNFWTNAQEKSKKYKFVIVLDIADFYNQIYHHTLENQLIECRFPNQIIKALKNMLQSTTQTVSRGIPVGPHASHLLAEMCLIQIDDNLILKGLDFCRYADDIVLFANSEKEMKLLIYEMVKLLDSSKLMLQQQKTKRLSVEEFQKYCNDMIFDDPINEFEQVIGSVLENYAIGPYEIVEDFEEYEEIGLVFSDENIEEVIQGHLKNAPSIDYPKIKWLYNRFSQFGVTNALSITIKYLDELMPALNTISQYFLSVADTSEVDLYEDGKKLFLLLDDDFVRSNKYIQICILSLFSHSDKFNCIDKLIKLYSNSDNNVKREIILSLYRVKKGSSWIREIKQEYESLDIWAKRALAIASSLLPKDERKFFINDINRSDNLAESIILDYVKNVD